MVSCENIYTDAEAWFPRAEEEQWGETEGEHRPPDLFLEVTEKCTVRERSSSSGKVGERRKNLFRVRKCLSWFEKKFKM